MLNSQKVEVRNRKSDSLLVGGNRASSRLKNRLQERIKNPRNYLFITLTYRPEDYKNGLQLYREQREKRHIQKFIERLQRYLGVSLKGKWARKMEMTKSGYLHFHLIINSQKYVPHADLTTIWGHGFVWINRLNQERLQYFCKYVAKSFEQLPSYLLGERPRSIKVVAVSPTFWGESTIDEQPKNQKPIKWCVFSTLENTLAAKTEIRTNDFTRVIHKDIYSVIRELENGGSFIDSLNNEWLALFTSTNTLNKLITNNTYANNSSHSEAENPADAGFSSLLDNGGKSPLCDDYVFHLLNGLEVIL